MPRITILMPAYNVGPWIREAIESVLKQTFADFTLLIIDDCSTDNTADVVRSFSDPRIRYEKNPRNLGLAENLNRGLELSDTEFCARMDGDDIAEPSWLETGIKVLETHPEVGICSFGFQFFGTKTSVVRFPEKHEDSKVQMLFGCTVIIPVFRRSVMADNGLRYSTEAFPAEDYDMWSRCYRLTQVYNVQQTMFHYRMHETQISTSKRIAQQEKSDIVRLRMLEWLNPDFSEEEKSFFLQKFVLGKIEVKEDVATFQKFADLLASRNVQNHYEKAALLRKFKTHIAYAALNFVEDEYFHKGYGICQYTNFLKSGLFGIVPVKNRRKILAKSLLMKKKMSVFSHIKRKLYNLTHPELGQILMLHRVTEQRSLLLANRELEVTPSFLEQTILSYKENGYRFVDMDEVARVVKGGMQKQKFVCFTFDDGYADNYTLAFPIFKKYNCPFTINITTDFYERKALLWWYVLEDLGVNDKEFSILREEIFRLKNSEIAPYFKERFPQKNYSFGQKVEQFALSTEQIKQLSDSGLCCIGCHTISHPRLSNLDREDQFYEVAVSKQKLETLIGKEVKHFAFPYGEFNNDTLGVLKETGFESAVRTWGGKVRRGMDKLNLCRMELKQ